MNRWLILLGYMLLTMGTQVAWLSYAPITTAVAQDLHSSAGMVGLLSAIFSAFYLLLGLPTGHMADRHFKRTLALGAGLNMVGVAIRVLAPHSFAVQMLGQLVLAVAQPFVVNAITGLAVRYFPEEDRPKAIAAGSASMFMGVLLASLTSPVLYDAGGLLLVLLVHGLVVILGGAWTLLALRTPPIYDKQHASADVFAGQTPTAKAVTSDGLGWLWRDSLLWKLGGLMFVGFGVFSALSTWLESLLKHHGINAVTSGNLLGGMVIMGILGSSLLPVFAAARGQRWSALLASFLVTLGLLGILAATSSVPVLAIALALSGFFLLACLPLVLEWAEGYVVAKHQGATVGFLMLAGNTGALILMLLVGAFVEEGLTVPLVVLALTMLLGVGVVLSLPRK